VAAEAIAAHLSRWPAAEDGSLWTTASGRVPRHDHYAKTIRAAVARVNMEALRRRAAGEGDVVSVPEDTSSHDLRHHYASLLIAAGVSSKTL
jgi:integrase